MYKFHVENVLLAVILLCIETSQVTCKEIFVNADHSQQCPVCVNMTYFIQDGWKMIESNTIVSFSAGEYHLTKDIIPPLFDGSITVNGVDNVTIRGGLHAIGGHTSFICSEGVSFGFTFLRVRNLLFHNMQFIGCGATYGNPVNTVLQTIYQELLAPVQLDIHGIENSALAFVFVDNLRLAHVVINDTYGAGILGINIGNHSTISNVMAAQNDPNIFLLYVDRSDNNGGTEMAILRLDNVQVLYGSPQWNLQWSVMKDNLPTSNIVQGSGISLVLAQSEYNVNVSIVDSVSLGNRAWTGANLHVVVGNCSSVANKIKVRNVSSIGGKTCAYGAGLNFEVKEFQNCKIGRNRRSFLKLVNFEVLSSSPISSSTDKFCHWISFSAVYLSAYNIPVIGRNITLRGNCKGMTALSTLSAKNITLRNVTISENKGPIMHLNESTMTFFEYTTITMNKISPSSSKEECHILQSNVNFIGHTTITNNRGYSETLFVQSSTIEFSGPTVFSGNYGHHYAGCIRGDNSWVTFGESVLFSDNSAGSGSGAIYATGSTKVAFYGNANFSHNTGVHGGALGLYRDSYILVSSVTAEVLFEYNTAAVYGGGIYVDSTCENKNTRCFYQLVYTDNDIQCPTSAHIFMRNNIAGIAGSALFGGFYSNCYAKGSYLYCKNFFETLFDIDEQEFISSNDDIKSVSPIASTPYKACLCENNTVNCNMTSTNFTIYPGETIHVPVVTVGQKMGVVPSSVSTAMLGLCSHITILQTVQQTQPYCTDLQYTIMSFNEKETLLIGVGAPSTFERRNTTLPDKQLAELECANVPITVNINLKQCPLGFEMRNGSCTCADVFVSAGINCSINTQEVYRPSPLWIKAVKTEAGQDIIIHKHCPFDYCKLNSCNLKLNDSDQQCTANRSGILCGGCKENFSTILGGDGCQQCSNAWIGLVFLFLLAGVVLVFIIMYLNFTVSVGTLNGLIFYANIIQVNKTVFMPSSGFPDSFARTFIAWLNLDFGIKTCFYNRLNAYVHTWHQFIFPIYIWAIVALIIILSHYFTVASKIFRRNTIMVLATLVLLSYTKMLRIAITAMSFTSLHHSNGTIEYVWLYDGNVPFFTGKHVPLFLAGLLVLLLLLPTTGILLFSQCLQRRSSHRFMWWFRKLQPFFDAYTGPYKEEYRYWMGLMLLFRGILYLVFSSNVLGDPSINLIAIVIVVLLVLILSDWHIGGIYKRRWIGMIESFYLLNLGTLAVSSLYTRSSPSQHQHVIYFCIGSAFAVFCGIVVYHVIISLKKSKTIKRKTENIKLQLSKFRQQSSTNGQPISASQEQLTSVRRSSSELELELPRTFSNTSQGSSSAVTQSVLMFTTTGDNELREPVLEFCGEFEPPSNNES